MEQVPPTIRQEPVLPAAAERISAESRAYSALERAQRHDDQERHRNIR
jgi:hypothetical protein